MMLPTSITMAVTNANAGISRRVLNWQTAEVCFAFSSWICRSTFCCMRSVNTSVERLASNARMRLFIVQIPSFQLRFQDLARPVEAGENCGLRKLENLCNGG